MKILRAVLLGVALVLWMGMPGARAEGAQDLKALNPIKPSIRRALHQPGNPVLVLFAHDAGVTDNLVEGLKDLKTLQRVGLNGTTVTNATLERLKGLDQLWYLDLPHTKV